MSNLSIAQKEISRIKRMVKRIEQRGFEVNLPAKYSGLKRSGEKKTKYTKRDIEELKSFKAKSVYDFAKYRTPSGRVISGKAGRAFERSQASIKGALTKKQQSSGLKPYKISNNQREKRIESIKSTIISRAIIDSFRNKNNYRGGKYSETVYEKAIKFLNDALSKYSEEQVAQALQEAKNDGTILEIYMAYDATIDQNLEDLAKYIDKSYEYKPQEADTYEDETEIPYDESVFNT